MEQPFIENNKHAEWIYWTGICNADRTNGLNQIKDCIDKFGFIQDFHLYSDISIALNVSIEEHKIGALYEALSDCVHLDFYEIKPSDKSIERTLMLNITFSKGTGDMKNEVIAVPG
jgi:hypothetical protein